MMKLLLVKLIFSQTRNLNINIYKIKVYGSIDRYEICISLKNYQNTKNKNKHVTISNNYFPNDYKSRL